MFARFTETARRRVVSWPLQEWGLIGGGDQREGYRDLGPGQAL